MCGGVFYREFTKYYGFKDVTHLGKLHVHTLALGMVVTILFYLLVRNLDEESLANLKKPLNIYNFGLIFTVANMMLIGIYEVVSKGTAAVNQAAMDGVSGIGHIFLGIGLIYTMVIIKKITEENSLKN